MKRDLSTPLSQIEGLGAAKSGTGHFWHQRLTAVALVPLAIWFVYSALSLVGADRDAVAAFFHAPVNAVLMLTFMGTALYHMSLGVQVVIEDYVHQEALKLLALIANRFFGIIVGLAAALALLKLALGA